MRTFDLNLEKFSQVSKKSRHFPVLLKEKSAKKSLKVCDTSKKKGRDVELFKANKSQRSAIVSATV